MNTVMTAAPEARWSRLFLVAMLATLMGLLSTPQAHAREEYLIAWQDTYPDSATDTNAGRQGGCQVCHGSSNGQWNAYGDDINARFPGGNADIVPVLRAVESLDSDADPTGSDNLTEINANAQPGWTPGLNPVFNSNGNQTSTVDPTSFLFNPVQPPLDPGAANQPPVADAGPEQTGVVDVNVMFDGTGSSDPDGTIVSYDWDFGDGATDSGPQPQHAYAGSGVFDVTLTVTDDAGDTSAPATTTATIDPANQAPTADPNGPYNGTVDVPLTFDGFASTDPDGTIAFYNWDFGDGTVVLDAGPTPTHTYAADGDFTVILTVTDNAGATDAATTTATIALGNQPPVADANGPYTGTAGSPVAFDGSGSNDPDGSIVAYDWDFGDGTFVPDAGATPTHTYASPGIYNVTLSVTDDVGATDSDLTTADIGAGNQPPVADPNGPYTGTVGSPVTFDGSASTDPDGTIVFYDWDFGDGTVVLDAGPMPTHSYAADGNFTVTLTVTGDAGDASAPATTTASIGAVNQSPLADAGPEQTGVVGVNVMFDGTGSSDPDGTIDSYDWNFGDGAIGTGPQPQHAYAGPGVFDVTLTVTDDAGDISAPATTTATIDPANQAPTADPNGPYNGTVDVAVTFDGSSSTDPDGTISSYDWDFGDGNTGTGVEPTHTYGTDGVFTVTLTVTDDAGATDAATTMATIALGNQPPVADPNGPYSGTVGEPVAFDGRGSEDPDGTNLAYDWEFGDGNIGTGPTPTHTYAAAGLYNVTLSVTDDEGATDSAGTTADIGAGTGNQPPVADPNGPYTGTAGAPVTFDGSGSTDPDGTIVAYDWDFGDGNTGTGVGPTHTYATDGVFTVTLTVTDDARDASAPATTTASIDGLDQPPSADARITEAEWDGEDSELEVEGSEAPPGATVLVTNADTGDRIGTARVDEEGEWELETVLDPSSVPCRVRAAIGEPFDEKDVEDAPADCR